MKFLSHIYEENNKVKEKLLKEHIYGDESEKLNGVLKIALHSKSENAFADYKELLINSIKLHDLGKYTDYFQDYLKTHQPHRKSWHFHSFVGAVTALNLYNNVDEKLAFIAYFIIKYHHSSLDDIQNSYYTRHSKGENLPTRKDRITAQRKQLLQYLSQIENENNIEIDEKNIANDIPNLKCVVKDIIKENSIENYYLINYLFSLLIEADKLDASRTVPYNRKSISTELVNNHIQKLSNGKPDPKDSRNIVRQKVLNNFEDKNILNERLFTLTAPTGVGKTLTSLDFALKLRAKLEHKPQIIYGLPFINIIEQAIKVYDDVISSKEAKVLAHYQYADAVGQQSKYENDEEQHNKGYEQKLKTLDCWQCDVVITTFVQLLQTLIGNRNKLLKRFNHFADSIIILDEVQTIKLGHQPLIGAALFYLSKFLNARIILMTATKPKIFELANHYLLKPDNEVAEPKELLNGYEEIFGEYHRTAIHTELLQIQLESEDDFVEKCFDEKCKKWDKDKSCLIVCNLVQRSIDVFEKIKKYVTDNEFPNPVYYLSTNIAPCERLYVIERVKLDLKSHKKPILISTQSIEAGVDLDFDMGFRDLAPIDSIIQVAGRINRNNNRDKNYSSLFIVKLVNKKGKSDCCRVYDEVTEQQSEKALKAISSNFTAVIKEPQYLDLVDSYYDLMTDVENPKVSLSESFKFFDSMKKLKYDGDKEEYPVSAFKVIDEKGYAVSVFVELDEYSKSLSNMFLKMLDKNDEDFGKEEFEKYKKDFHQRIIAVPKYLKKAEMLKMCAEDRGDKNYQLIEGILKIPREELTNFYDLKTGFRRDSDDLRAELSMF